MYGADCGAFIWHCQPALSVGERLRAHTPTTINHKIADAARRSNAGNSSTQRCRYWTTYARKAGTNKRRPSSDQHLHKPKHVRYNPDVSDNSVENMGAPTTKAGGANPDMRHERQLGEYNAKVALSARDLGTMLYAMRL